MIVNLRLKGDNSKKDDEKGERRRKEDKARQKMMQNKRMAKLKECFLVCQTKR